MCSLLCLKITVASRKNADHKNSKEQTEESEVGEGRKKTQKKEKQSKKQEFYEKGNFVTRKKESKCRELKYEKGK
jgi:hypothetical protein